MLIKDWMTEEVITVNPNTSMNDAIKLMERNQVRILPVLKRDKIVGVVTHLDIKRASSSDATTLDVHELHHLISKIRLAEIMNKTPDAVPMDFTIGEAAEIMILNKISGLLVVDQGGQLAGVITQTDIFKALISMTGTDRKGIEFAFQVEDRPGSIKELTDIIREYGGRLLSILTSYDRAPQGYRKLYLRAYAINRQHLSQLKQELADSATLLYMIDHRENKREIG
jgi:acetoin utilization protein AcuB